MRVASLALVGLLTSGMPRPRPYGLMSGGRGASGMRSGTVRLAAALTMVLAMGGALGCAAQPDVRALWTMPGATARGQAPPAGTPGYNWAYAGQSGAGADSGVAEVGDLPETALPPRDTLWRGDEAAARRLAVRSAKPLIVDFYADWCQPCMRMAADTFRDAELRTLMGEAFVALQINVTEETRANREQLERYAVDQLPTLLVIAPDGTELARIDRFISAAELHDRLSALVSKTTESDGALRATVAPTP